MGRNLATACQDGKNVQAREQVAFGSSLSGMVMSVDNLCSEHAMEHPLSAYYHEIAHGAGLIMLSRAYYTHFVEHCPSFTTGLSTWPRPWARPTPRSPWTL